jgi:hypothetical protein
MGDTETYDVEVTLQLLYVIMYGYRASQNTIFSRMQDDSKIRQPTRYNMSAKGKCIYQNLR